MIDELLFLAWSQVLRMPWAPDPWLRAKQRAHFSVRMAEAKAAEVYARLAVLEELKAELLDVVDELDAWAERAKLYAYHAELLKDESPWVHPVAAKDEGPPESKHWRWSETVGGYVRIEGAEDDVE